MNNPNFQQNAMGGPRPQAGNGLQQFVQHYRQQLQQQKIPQGWQQSISPEERGQLCQQFYTQYRLLKPDSADMEAMRASVNFETQNFIGSGSKEQYVNNIKSKLLMMTQARQQQMARMGGNLGPASLGPMNNAMSNAMNSAQMHMMSQPGLQGPRQGTPQQQFNSAFPNAHLQRPMQVSPVPMSQAQSSMGMNNGNPANLNQGQDPQQPNANQTPQNPRQENAIINQFAKRLMDTCKDEVKAKFQQDVASWPEHKKAQLMSQGVEPIFFRFRQHAEALYRGGALNRPPGANGNPMQPGAQGRMANQMGANQRQSNQDFDMNAIANQQMEAMRVQDQGAMVVPASNNANGAQMNGFPGQNPQQPQQQNAAAAQRQAAEAAAFQNTIQRQQVQQMQQAQAQSLAHAQLEQQRQRQAAQARNPNQLNPNQLLQGLNGGLNLPPSSQSPGPMSMLNRPMHPPGQPGTPTPQQQPQNHVPVMTPRPGQMNNDPQPLTEQLRMSMMPADFEPHVKQHLLKVPDQQFRAIVQQHMHQRRANGAIPFQGLQPNQGQPNPLFNQQPPNQPGMPNQMIGNMGRPGLNIGQQMSGLGQQHPMGQRPQQAPSQQQRLHNANQLLRQNPGIIQATDIRPYPPNVLGQQVRANIPPEIKSWGQLKQWATQNPALIAGISMDKLLLLQVLHFQDLMKQQNSGQAQQQNAMPGLAPPAQMTPNQAAVRTPQPQPNMQVTPQEVQQLRQKLPPQQMNVSDDQLRQYIVQQKVKARQQQAQLQQQQHLQSAMLAQRAGQQPQQSMPGQQQPPNRPPTAQPQGTQPTPQPKAVPRPQPLPQTNQPNVATNKGMKRPNEDTAEVVVDVSSTTVAPQAPAMVPTRSGAGLSFTPEQMSKMTPTQQAQMRAQLLKAQDASNATGNKMQPQQQNATPNNEEIRARMVDPARMKAFNQLVDEVERSIPPRQYVQLPPQLRAPLQQSLKDQLDKMKKIEQALRIFHASYNGPEYEGIIKQVVHARALVFQQINKQDGTLHDQVTLTTEEFKTHMRAMLSFYAKVTHRMASGQNAVQQPQPQQGPNSLPAQLNAANLKIVEQQQRQQKPPSAPTTDRPPFALGDQSARGAPTYFEGAKTVTNLVLPDKKRAKLEPGSQTSTPGPRPSPRMGAGKAQGHSPELTRQPPPSKQVPQRPTFQCKSPDCEYSVRGFDTQADLDAHVGQVHAKIENPLQFALESMAEYLDVDPKTGEPRVDPNNARLLTKAAPAASRAAQPGKLEHTPNVPANAGTPAGTQVAATPMARVPTQTGMKSSPVTNFLKTPQAMAKVATPGSGAHAKATPTSMPRPAPKEQTVAAPEPMKAEEQPLMPMSLLDYSYEDTFAALDANGPFTCLDLKDEDTTWAVRSRPASPMTTPESSAKDTPSTRTSDISENDNLHINLDLTDMDMPDAWTMGFNDNALPMDMQLSEDMQNLGVMLPPMDNDDMMLFPSYGDGMMDLETLEKTMDSMGGSLDPSMLGPM